MKDTLRILLIGMMMGAAEVVPGVSGGTIAFISGVYERLVHSLKQFTPYLLLELKRSGIRRVWEIVDGNFLVTLFLGMGISIILFASLVSYLLNNEPVALWSFFFGLVVASVWVVAARLSRFGMELLVAAVFGMVIGLVVTSLYPFELAPTPLNIFLGGAIAVCAWILPGLSGSFILLILGLYAVVIDAIRQFEFSVLIALGLGCALGLLSFAQVLSRLFRYFRDETLAVLTGFMLGSLVKLWPWKETTSYQIRADGSQIPLIQEPVSPADYLVLTGQDPDLSIALAAAVIGCLLVLGLQRFAPQNGQDT